MKSGREPSTLGVVLGGVAVLALLVASAFGLVHMATAAKTAPSLAGLWRLDPSKSDMPGGHGGGHGGWGAGAGGAGGGAWGGGHHHGGMGGDGGMGGGFGHHGGHEGMGGGPPDSTRMGGAMARRLPDLIRIQQTANDVTFADSAGSALLQVLTSTSNAGAPEPGAQAEQFTGKWNGDHLEFKRPGPGGQDVTQKIHLEDKGRTLVIETKIPGNGERPGRDLKRVYRMEGTS